MKRFNITKFVIVLLLVAFAFGSFAPTAQAAGRKGNTIVDVALAANAQTGEFSILIAALQAADPSSDPNPERQKTTHRLRPH
ncbi:MAG: hypothetical protein MZV63_06645 [Marinilabiliales bacterium]|nr:hypothetical protein [Marinilabiliales bacterium]